MLKDCASMQYVVWGVLKGSFSTRLGTCTETVLIQFLHTPTLLIFTPAQQHLHTAFGLGNMIRLT